MSIPDPDTADPIAADESLLARVRDLVERAFRRQLWVFFIDENGRQLSVLPQIDIPRRPDAHGGTVMANLRLLARRVGAVEMAIVYERPGPERLSIDDRRWLRLLASDARSDGVRLRGPLFAHARGVRWIGPEDLDDPVPTTPSSAKGGRGHR